MLIFVLMAQNSSHLGQQIEIFDFDDDMDNDLGFLLQITVKVLLVVEVLFISILLWGEQSYEDADLRLVGSTLVVLWVPLLDLVVISMVMAILIS